MDYMVMSLTNPHTIRGRPTLKDVERGFRRFLYTNWESLCQAFLAESVETGTRNRCVIEATHVLRRKIRKD